MFSDGFEPLSTYGKVLMMTSQAVPFIWPLCSVTPMLVGFVLSSVMLTVPTAE